MTSTLNLKRAFGRKLWLPALTLSLLVLALVSAPSSEANHPVYLEGNCDSPVPGTTLVSLGTCGDFDGDGRIGTAEDTDGADRIFGTLAAAIGPGTGAAAGTGANMNGRVIIVASGRYAELITITTASHLQIEAAPGIAATVDAVLQGDPASGNATRQNDVGINILVDPGATVILRNLTIRNYSTGIRVLGNGRVLVDNCRIENNLSFGIEAGGDSRVIVENTMIAGTGRRIGGPSNVANPGHGIRFAANASGVLSRSGILNSVGAGVHNASTRDTVIVATFLTDNDGGSVLGKALIQAQY